MIANANARLIGARRPADYERQSLERVERCVERCLAVGEKLKDRCLQGSSSGK